MNRRTPKSLIRVLVQLFIIGFAVSAAVAIQPSWLPVASFNAAQDAEEAANASDTGERSEGKDASAAPILDSPNGEDDRESRRQAGRGDGKLKAMRRFHHARLNRYGDLVGRISVIDAETRQLIPVKDMRVYFVRSGEVVQRVEVMPDGTFIARRLQPEVYSLIGAGPDGFVAYSVHVLPPRPDGGDASGTPDGPRRNTERSPKYAIHATAVPPASFAAVLQLIEIHVPADARLARREEAATEAVPAEARTFDDSVAETEGFVPATSIRSHQIRLQPDGRLLGRVRCLHTETARPFSVRETYVCLVRDDNVIAQTPADEAGVFTFHDVPPGIYSLVVVPREDGSAADVFHQGFAAFSFEAVPHGPDRANVEGPQFTFVSFMAEEEGGGEAPQIDVSLVNPNDFGVLNEIVGEELVPGAPGAAPPPVAAAPAALGAGGGGAAGAAGGAGAAAAGPAAAAAAANQGSQPASPFAP